jgi:hypothetical protein
MFAFARAGLALGFQVATNGSVSNMGRPLLGACGPKPGEVLTALSAVPRANDGRTLLAVYARPGRQTGSSAPRAAERWVVCDAASDKILAEAVMPVDVFVQRQVTAATWLADDTFVLAGRQVLMHGSVDAELKLKLRTITHGRPWFQPVSLTCTGTHLALVDASRNALWATTLTTCADGSQLVDCAWREVTEDAHTWLGLGVLKQVCADPVDAGAVLTHEISHQGTSVVRHWYLSDPRYGSAEQLSGPQWAAHFPEALEVLVAVPGMPSAVVLKTLSAVASQPM